MTTHRDALEAFNRATHSDALREMQLTGPTVSDYPYTDPVPSTLYRCVTGSGNVAIGTPAQLANVSTPSTVLRSMGARDLFVSIATAVLLVIVIPLGLLVLSVLAR